jgi:hypothetical protein
MLTNIIFAFKVLNHDTHSLKFAFCITHFAEISTILTDEISRKNISDRNEGIFGIKKIHPKNTMILY